MIEQVGEQFQLRELEAETDADAVGVFIVAVVLKSPAWVRRYPGVERFRCVKKFATNERE